jgi:hypothetical protein
MATSKPATARVKAAFGSSLGNEQLTGLTAELQKLRAHPPLVKRSPGKYEGDILGFVKGLRLSARLIYFLRERLGETLSGLNLEISWGQLLDESGELCSPECDVIIHSKGGHVREWNGSKGSIMEFRFVKVARARVVISCKSQLSSIEKRYVKDLNKFGVGNVFLFAECCSERRFPRLRDNAVAAGYIGLCCLYFTGPTDNPLEVDETMWGDFAEAIIKALE